MADRIYTGNLRYYLAIGSSDEVLQVGYREKEGGAEKWEEVNEDDIPLIVEEDQDTLPLEDEETGPR